MAGISLADAQEQLDAWLKASLAISKGQSYKHGDVELTRADLSAVQRQIEYWEKKVGQLGGGGRRMTFRGVTPVDGR